MADSPECPAAIQRDLDSLEKWADRDLVFNKKCTVLHPGKDNSKHQYMQGATQLESSLKEKALQVLVDSTSLPQKAKLNSMSLPHRHLVVFLAALGKSIVSRSKEVILPLCSVLVRLQL